MPSQTKIRSRLRSDQIRSYSMDSRTTARTLAMLGISMDDAVFKDAVALAQRYPSAFGLDAAPSPLTTPSVPNAIQFLQQWLAPMVEIVTWARTCDLLWGRTMSGAWYQEEIVQPVLEKTGQSRPYSDISDTNLANWNINFNTRTIVRQELDVFAGVLESLRSGAMRIDNIGVKRNAAANSLEITRNAIGFYGYNSGYGRTYGTFNDPGLLPYLTAATGTGGDTTFASKTFLEIYNDFKFAAKTLRVQSGTNINPNTAKVKVGIASAAYDYLNTWNVQGTQTVMQAIKETFPNWEIIAVPEFDAADGGENVMYLIADSIVGQPVGDQFCQDLLRLIGMEPKGKGFLEVYSNATAGIMVKQPVGVVRMSGI